MVEPPRRRSGGTAPPTAGVAEQTPPPPEWPCTFSSYPQSQDDAFSPHSTQVGSRQQAAGSKHNSLATAQIPRHSPSLPIMSKSEHQECDTPCSRTSQGSRP